MTVYEALTEYRFMQTLPKLIRDMVADLEADRVLTPEAKRDLRNRLRRELFRAGIACQEAQKAVKAQPDPRRQILTMFYLEGIDQAYIADALAICRRNVCRHVAEAKEDLGKKEIIFPDMDAFLAARRKPAT